jgi:drug/metabolite transporter (DMT)-like permease
LDMLLIASYASLLFFARWVLVVALTHMKAYVATLLMNLQFVVMIVVGAVVFAELPSLNLIIGASVIILAGIYLLIETTGFRLGQQRTSTV